MIFKTLKGKIIFSISFTIILFGLSIAFNIFSLLSSNHGFERYKDLSDKTNGITEVEINFFYSSLALKDYLANYDDEAKKIFNNNIENAQKYFIVETENSTIVQNIANELEKYQQDFIRITRLNEEKDILIINNFNTISKNIMQTISNFKIEAKNNYISTFEFYSETIMQLFEDIIDASSNFFLYKSPDDKNRTYNRFEEINSYYEKVQSEILTYESYGSNLEQLKQLFKEIQNQSELLQTTFNQIVEKIETQEPIIQEMEQLRVEILNLLEDQRSQLKEQQDTLGPQLIEKNNNSILLTIVLTVIAFVVAIIMVIYLIRSITKPLLELRNKINQFKEGDLTVDFQVKSKDEIGQMALALSEMSKELRNSMGSIRQASDKVQESSVNLTKTSQESRENSRTKKTNGYDTDICRRDSRKYRRSNLRGRRSSKSSARSIARCTKIK